MKAVTGLFFATFIILITACGGSPGDQVNTPIISAPSSVPDKYDIDSYMGARVKSNSIIGTWLYVESFDMRYRYGFNTPGEYRRVIQKSRSLVSITTDSENPNIFSLTLSSHAAENHVSGYYDNQLYFDLDSGYFSGEVFDNSLIIGEIFSTNPDGVDEYLIIDSSSAAMVKISNEPFVPDSASPSWGEVQLSYSVASSSADDFSGRLPIHFFSETEFAFQAYDVAGFNGEAKIHEWRFVNLVDESGAAPLAAGQRHARFYQVLSDTIDSERPSYTNINFMLIGEKGETTWSYSKEESVTNWTPPNSQLWTIDLDYQSQNDSGDLFGFDVSMDMSL